MQKELRWGIMAPGWIGHKFAQALEAVEGSYLAAVASRDPQRARDFAADYNRADCAPVRVLESYQKLAEDPDIDAVYVASVHPFHMEQTIMALQNGKAVLCEKPFAVNARQAETMIRAARDNKLFLMEAMWSRFLPAIGEAKARIKAGDIGSLRTIRADLSFCKPVPHQHRLLNPELAGGALLDVGIYVLSLSSFFMDGLPQKVSGLAEIGPSGVDIQNAISCQWPDGRTGILSSGLLADGPVCMEIIGTEGRIEIPRMFFTSEKFKLVKETGQQEFEQKHLKNGYEYQIIEVSQCLARGATESSIMPLEESLKLLEIMDSLRQDWGLRYPCE